MSKIAFVFPGQGSQTVGMGKDLYDNFESAKKILDNSSNIIDIDVKDMCFNGPSESLMQTENTQPCVVTISIAAMEVLKSKKNIRPELIAGHSLGEFSAYIASEAISFEDGIKLVRERGKLMASADKDGKGAMAAIIGIDDNIIEDVCKKASEIGLVVPANYNSQGQIVISGEKEAVSKAIELAKENKAKIAKLLPVSTAFHSPMMSSILNDFEIFLNAINISSPKIPVISNVYADILKTEDIKPSLVKQITSPVLWTKSIQKMISDGIDTFIELGNGKVLQGLISKIDKNVKVFGIEDSTSLEKTLSLI